MHNIEAKTILSAKNGMNLYRGCTHGCIYCDSRSDCYGMDHEFEDIAVKSNAIELLEDALRRKRKPCMIGTGSMCDPYMHCEEKLGLKWDDINFATGELSIRREYTTLGSDYIISTPKTKSSVRSVHLPQSVLNILGEYRKTVNSEWVCPSPLDPTHPRSPTSCRSRLSDMLERAECNHIPFHGLRHIFSTMALENGLEIKTLSAVLGHSSAETTISVYSHVTGEMERNAAKKMDDAFGTPKPADSPVCDDNPDDGQTPEQEPKRAEFTAKKSKKRKPGTGCISKVSKNTWQGKYTPRGKDGKLEQHIVYAKSEEECERKLGEMIKELKNGAVTR